MKIFKTVFLFLLPVFLLVPMAQAATDFDLVLLGGGGYYNYDLKMKLSIFDNCSNRGYCEIGGYGFEVGKEEDIINFRGEGEVVGDYYHIWLNGIGRTMTPTKTYVTKYEIQIRVYLPSLTLSNQHRYHSTISRSNGDADILHSGGVLVQLN